MMDRIFSDDQIVLMYCLYHAAAQIKLISLLQEEKIKVSLVDNGFHHLCYSKISKKSNLTIYEYEFI